MPTVASNPPRQSWRPVWRDSRHGRQFGALCGEPLPVPCCVPVWVTALAIWHPASAGRDPLVAEFRQAGRLSDGAHHWAAGHLCCPLLWVVVCVIDSRHFFSQCFSEPAGERVVLLFLLPFHREALRAWSVCRGQRLCERRRPRLLARRQHARLESLAALVLLWVLMVVVLLVGRWLLHLSASVGCGPRCGWRRRPPRRGLHQPCWWLRSCRAGCRWRWRR